MLLAKLIKTLSEDEIRKIRDDFQLPERSRLIFERIATSPSSPPNAENLVKAFRITKENFYSICSEIVDECVRILARNEEFSTLKFYKSKFLYRPFVTEAQRIEKRLLGAGEKKTLEQFYEFVFLNIFQFPADGIDLDLAEDFGNKWHRSKQHPPINDDLYIRLYVTVHRIGALAKKKKMTLAQMSDSARAFLDPISDDAEHSPNPLVRYYYYQAEWKAAIYQNIEGQIKIEWLLRSLHVIQENRSLFPPELEESVELQVAYELAMNCNRAIEGLEIFRKFYREQTPETLPGAIYLVRFSRVAFLARDFAASRKMAGEFERYKDSLTTPTIYISALLTKTMLEIIEGSSSTASRTIEIAKASHQEHFSLANEVVIRGLDTVIALKHGNLAEAEQLVERNIKWLRSRRLSLPTTSWMYFYQMIAAIIRYRMIGEPIRITLFEHFTTDFRSEYPEFFFLLENEMLDLQQVKNKM
jgi:hypothetical protein